MEKGGGWPKKKGEGGKMGGFGVVDLLVFGETPVIYHQENNEQ